MKNGLNRWSTFAVASLIIALFSTSALATEKTVVQFWTGWEGIRTDAWMMLVDEFNATHDTIQIDAMQRVADANNLFPTLAAGVAPDIVFSSSVWTQDHARNHVLADLTPYLSREGIDLNAEILPGLMAPNLLNGQPHAIPVNGEIYWAFTNRTVLDAAGLPLPAPGGTWADVRIYSQQLTRVDASGAMERAGFIPAIPYGTTLTLIAQAGGRIMNEAGTGPAVNSPQVRQAFEFIDSMLDSNLFGPPGVAGRNMFLEDRAAFLIDGSQRTSLLEQQMEPGNLLVGPMPVGPAGSPQAWGSALTLAMVDTKDPVRMAAAWEALKWLSSARSQAIYNAYVLAIPTRVDSIRDPLFTQMYETTPVMQQWVENVFPYATGDGFIGLPGPAVTVLTTRFPQFFGAERPPVGTFLIELEHDLQVVFDDMLRSSN